MALRSDETFHRLQQWTSGSTLAERLAAQILQDAGYTEIHPIHPLGGPDGRRDADAVRDGKPWLMAAYFPRGQQSFSDIKAKLIHDAAGVTMHNAHGLAFVTNQRLTDSQRTELQRAAGVPLDAFDVERLVLALDSPPMLALRRQYLYIDFAADTPGRERPSEARLLELGLRQADVRRRRRLRAAGVPDDLHEAVLRWMSEHPSGSELPPIEAGVLTVLAAPAGAGKTEAAHDWYCAAVEAAIADPTYPFPVWIDARHVPDTDLLSVLDNRVGRAVIDAVGCDVVLDSLDQLDPLSARHLLESAEELCSWDRVSVLATARPEASLSMFDLTTVPGWDRTNGRGLAELVAGKGLPDAAMSSEVGESLERPLLAIALGLRVGTGDVETLSPAALISELSDRVLRSYGLVATRDLSDALTAMAAHIITTGCPYPASALTADLRRVVRQTPIVSDDAGQLSFSLPIHEQTYGARAITTKMVALGVVASADNFPVWRYALALSISFEHPHEGDRVLGVVTASNPAAGSWLVDELQRARGSGEVSRDTDSASPGDTDESSVLLRHTLLLDEADGSIEPAVLAVAAPLRDAYRTFATALGPLATELSRRPADVSKPAGWDVKLEAPDRMLLAWRTGDDDADIGRFPDEVNPWNPGASWDARRWPWIQSLGTPTEQLGRWRWARDLIRAQLETRLKEVALSATPTGIVGLERRWYLAQLVHRRTDGVGHMPIPISDLRVSIENQLTQTSDSVRATWQVSGRRYTREDLLWLQARLPDEDLLVRPAPAPDQRHGLGGWISSLYSPEQLRSLVQHVMTGALDAYADLVEHNFTGFGPALGISALAPIRIYGHINMDDANTDSDDHDPTLSYAMVRDDTDGRAPRVDIDLRWGRDGSAFIPPPSNRAGRGHGRFSRPHVTHTILEVYGSRPSTMIAYNWLIDDLARIGWVERHFRVR